ncbi:MAG: bifunctional oligoribonuclease/PAP phosphatase NrnA [Clostridia bacterium]|nr:bifunctional oligoribonuclease/PAP phosphatase NrnA [Clostridia bacterium]
MDRYEVIRELIDSHDRIAIHRHTNPDGDAVGSQIGLKHIILDNFPGKTVVCPGDPPGRYSFMPDSSPDTVDDSFYDGALSVVLDTSSASLISDGRYALAKTTLRIDHHLFLEKICGTEIVDPTFESCCGIIADASISLGLRFSPLSAGLLFTGIVTDSGRFRYDSVNSRTFALASKLMEQDFSTNDIYRNLYSDSYRSMATRASFLLRVRFTEHRVAYIYSTAADVAESGLDSFSASRGMVGTMSEIRGTGIWVNFTESDSGVLCEIRSSDRNINGIAVKYGGGGHAKASGATLKDREEAMKLLSDLDALAASC